MNLLRSSSAVLICRKDPSAIEEAMGLCEAAGYHVVQLVRMRGLKHGRFGVGAGKADEAKRAVVDFNATCVVVDDKLSVAESYNLAKHCNCKVVDRERLVLDIFRSRATSQEASLQVKMAELTYELPRARDYVRLVRRGEQPGMFGFGSYEVEKYYRNIRGRLESTKRKLAVLRRRREMLRSQRAKVHMPIVSLAGYTAAGKTTLFNRLVSEKQPVMNSLFSTLTTTTRRLTISGSPILLSDTVGFISRLPHYMIEAFKSTLEELAYADLVLLVIDGSDEERRMSMKYNACMDTLADLNVSQGKVITVFNKVDLVGWEELAARVARFDPSCQSSVIISAKTGQGVGQLLTSIERRLKDIATVDSAVAKGTEIRSSGGPELCVPSEGKEVSPIQGGDDGPKVDMVSDFQELLE